MSTGAATAAPDTPKIVTVGADMAGWRIDRALAALVPTLSRERLKALIGAGHVTGVSGAHHRDPARKVAAGDVLSVVVPAATDPRRRSRRTFR